MGKTKSRKHTKTKINVPNQGEVFILTPDILQKLGISLGDIATTQQPNQNPDNKRDTVKNRKKKNKTSVSNSSGSVSNERIPQKEPVKPNKSKTSDGKSSSLLEKALTSKTFLNTPSLSSSCDIISNVQETTNDSLFMSSRDSVPNNVNDSDRSSSIVETALLMKKSVFLSPSFFVNTLQDEIAQEPSTDVSVELMLPEDIGVKTNYLVNNVQEMAILSESFHSSDSIPVQISETLHSKSSPVCPKDKFGETDEDIPLSQLRVSLLKTKNNTMSEIEIPITSDNSNANLKEQSFLNSKGKNSNVNVIVNKNIVEPNLDPVNVESNIDTSKTYNGFSDISQDESLATSHHLEELNVIAASKINEECKMKDVDDDLPLDDCSNNDTENVDYFEEEYTLDNNNVNQETAPGKDIQDSQKKISKIKIISEEIIDSFHLKEIKIPRNTTKLRLTPVSIETKISKDTSCKIQDVHGISGNPNVEHNLNTVSNTKNSVSENKVNETNISKDESSNSEDISNKKDIFEKPYVEHNLNTDSNGINSVSENKVKEIKISKDASCNSEDVFCKKDTSEKPNVDRNLDTDSNSKNRPSENEVNDINISKDESSNNEDISSHKDISEKPKLEHNLKTDSNDKNNDSEKKAKETNILKDESSNSENISSDKDISDKTKDKHNFNTDSKEKGSVSENKVKEIADYLRQIIKRRNSEQIIRDEKKIALNSKRHKINSKLSAQGVEKPGGGESNQINLWKHKIIKSYSHCRKLKNTKKDKLVEYIKKNVLKRPPANIDCNDMSPESNKILQEWCVCSDFGKLDVYCKNESYEHIHFWYHQNVVKNSEIIYSIYNEDGLSKDNVNETVESNMDEPECAIICWCNTKVNNYEANHVTEKEDNIPGDLIKQDHKKNRKSSFKEMKANTAPSSSDVPICYLKSEKDVTTPRSSSANSSTDKYEIKNSSAKDIHSPSQSKTQSHCLNNETAKMAKQRVTRNSVTIKEDSHLTHNNNVKDDPTSNIRSHSIMRRKSIRLSLNESNTVANSITKAMEDTSTATSKKSSGIEVEKLVKPTKSTKSAEVVDTKTKNKEITNTSSTETIKRIKTETQSPSTSANKKYHVIEMEKSTQKTPMNKDEPRKRSRKSTSVEVVEKNKNNQYEQPINLKYNETIKKPKVLDVPSVSSFNQISVSIAEKPVKLTRSSTSVEATDNKSGNKKNQLEQKTYSKRDTRNRSDVTAASSESATENSSGVNKDKPVKRTRNSTSAEVVDKSVNKISQSEQSIKPKDSKEIIVTKVIEAPSIPTIKKSPAVDKDKPAKRNRTSTNLEARDTKIGKTNYALEQSIDTSASETIRETRNVDAMSTSHVKSPSSNKTESRKRTSNSITVEAVNNHNEPSKSTESQSCTTQRISQRNPSTADNSDSPAKRVRQRTETVEFVPALPAGNVNIPIEQEIKTEPVSEHNRPDENSFDEPSVSDMIEQGSNSLVTCGVCSDVVSDESWQQHLKSHNYLAWKSTERPLDLNDREEIKQYLLIIARVQGGLYCSNCGIVRKYPKSYLHHIDSCDGNTTVNLETSTASAMDTTQESITDANYSLVTPKRAKRQTVDEIVKCGVCKEEVFNSNWIEHIRIKHQYLAKREGEIPLDKNDVEEVKEHLYKISRNNGGLICNQCGANRRYVKVYLDHIKACQGVEEVMEEVEIEPIVDTEIICGVCKLEVSGKEWYKHIQSEHKYMAWVDGEPPLNVNDRQQVLQHLQNIAKKTGRLYCWYCNESRKIAKIFLQHVTLCEESGFSGKRAEPNPNLAPDQFECGVCHEIGKKTEWKTHAMSNHYNVAWMVGEIPINIKNFYAVDRYLKEYQHKQGSFVCKTCGLTRSSNYGFYAHILICGKSEDEVEELMNYCDICNKKYVCIYKNQHMAAHRDAELKKERKEMEEEMKKEKEEQEKNLPPLPNGKRRAAAKAQKVLAELTEHEDGQPAIKRRRISDSEDSLKMEEDSYESDSQESEIDSNHSDEENDVSNVRHRKAPLPKLQRMPFKVENPSKYLKQSYLDYQKYHLTNECLYNEWRHTELKSVSEASKYIPTVKTSCKVKWDGGDWYTLKRFDSMKINKSFSLFAGGCIQCMSWVPEDPVSDSNFYLAVSTHRGPDVPRYDKDKIAVHNGLIQIWSFADFRSAPVLALGIAHNFGTIWAMDWCASGARDIVPTECSDKTSLRLGLLAVATSSGGVYIISVPYPPDVNNREMIICEAQAVVELRLNYNAKSKFQATSICWSPQKGHSTILVGYADGTTAFYDLNTTSPLLKDRSPDTNVTIIYPFLEKKTENSPISALSVTPTLDSSRIVGSVCSGGASGASIWSGETPSAWLRTALAARTAVHAAHWPAHRLLAEIAVSGKVINEMDWYGGGRRIGPMSESASCARCAASVVAAPPNVRLVRAHPAHPEVKKRIIATLQMVPMNLKVPLKKMKDDNVIVLQPVTYKDAVGKYGLEFKMISKRVSKPSEEIEQRADRFPLSEVTAASFCPSDRYHHRVALASHAGIVFVFNALN